MMDRRAFIAGAVALSATPPPAEAQPAGKIPRIGVLLAASPGDTVQVREAFQLGLRGLGYVEGRNITIEYRFAEGRVDRFADFASELVRLRVDVIVAPGTPAAQATRTATATIPIVLVTAGNPVGDGLIKSYARPGGNVTGLTMVASLEIGGKFLELLKEAVPPVSRVAVLWNPVTTPHTVILRAAEAAARVLMVALQPVSARRPEEIDGAFAAISRGHTDGLIVLADAMFVALRWRIAALTTKSRLPTMCGFREHTEAGGLMSYAPNLPDLWRRAAGYIDRILKGAKPADLPVEQPTRFELVINLKTAKALGLTMPPSLLARADQLIE
jgi:putative ABC transport system substrate-binding protein